MTTADDRNGGGFEQYKDTALYAYPDVAAPVLLFWCTLSASPAGAFTIAQAWNQPTNAGCFLFVSNPATNLQNLAAVHSAMKALPQGGSTYNSSAAPARGSRGFIWLDVEARIASVLTVTWDTPATIAGDITLGFDTGVSALALKAGAAVTAASDGQSFTFLYPANIPQTDPPPVSQAYPITLDLLGMAAGQFQFTGFMPQYGYYYQYGIVVDPLNAANCSQNIIMFAIQLVPTGLPFPAYAIQVPPQE